MPISVVCPSCKARFNVSEKFAGQKGPCPKCKQPIVIPAVQEEVKVHVPEQFQSGGKDSKGLRGQQAAVCAKRRRSRRSAW